MEILEMENLKTYTTIRIGGMAEKLYIPENQSELVELLDNLNGQQYRILGGGSNILMDDEQTFPHVIYMKKCNTELEHVGDGVFRCGASVRLQQLIQFTNSEGYGGIEYLMSVPGMIGGAVTMNAGRGKKHNQTISDYIIDVVVWDAGTIRTMSKEECAFSHRNSVFKNSDMVILAVTFRFMPEEPSILEEKRKARIEYSKNCQDNKYSNFGSLFCSCNHVAMRMIKRFGLCGCGDVGFSRKTSNWLINKGNGTFQQAMKAITKARKLNRLFGTDASLEVIVWKQMEREYE